MSCYFLIVSIASIELRPRFGNMLGGTPVLINPGVPLAGGEEIGCNFNGIETAGVHINSNLALCVSPTLPDFGSIPFELRIAGRSPQETDFLSGMYMLLFQYIQYMVTELTCSACARV